MDFSQPPPICGPMGPPPPINFTMPPPGIPRTGGSMQGSMHMPPPKQHQGFHRPFNSNFVRGPGGVPMSQDDFDGKRLRKSVMRKTVDYNASCIRALEVRFFFIINFCFYLRFLY